MHIHAKLCSCGELSTVSAFLQSSFVGVNSV